MKREVVLAGVQVIVESRSSVDVRACPRGPLLVRGADAVREADGTLHPTTRPVVALCACGKSQREVWCDGTHKVIPNHRQ